MSKASDIWLKQESPLWLLLTARSNATDANKNYYSLDRAEQFTHLLTQNITADIERQDFSDLLPPSQRNIFRIFASESLEYHRLFYNRQTRPYDEYTATLISEYNSCYPDNKVGLKNYQIHDNPQIVCNMMIGVALASIRDMALLEYLHEHDTITVQEYEFGLAEINDRMNRVGINGVDKLFESSPLLEAFVKQDIRPISVLHMHGRGGYQTKTRAAAYNVEQYQLKGFSFEKEGLTSLREEIISPTFPALAQSKQKTIFNTADVAPPLPGTKHKFLWHTTPSRRKEMQTRLQVEAGRHGLTEISEYQNFLIHDGVAIDHPARETYAESLRTRIKNKNEQPHIEIIDASQIDDELMHVSPNDPSPPEAGTSAISAITTPQQNAAPSSPNTDDIEDAHVIEYIPYIRDKKDADEIIHLIAESYDELDQQQGHSHSALPEKPTKVSNPAKYATLGGAALLAGMALSNHRTHNPKPKPSSGTNTFSLTKPLIFAGVAAVTLGSAIIWHRKSAQANKSMQELVEKVSDSLGRS